MNVEREEGKKKEEAKGMMKIKRAAPDVKSFLILLRRKTEFRP